MWKKQTNSEMSLLAVMNRRLWLVKGFSVVEGYILNDTLDTVNTEPGSHPLSTYTHKTLLVISMYGIIYCTVPLAFIPSRLPFKKNTFTEFMQAEIEHK